MKQDFQTKLDKYFNPNFEGPLSFGDMLRGIVGQHISLLAAHLIISLICTIGMLITKGTIEGALTTANVVYNVLYIPSMLIYIGILLACLRLIVVRFRTNGYSHGYIKSAMFVIALGMFLQFNGLPQTLISGFIVLLYGSRLVLRRGA